MRMGQTIKAPVGHYKHFGFYYKANGEPLQYFEQINDMMGFTLDGIMLAIRNSY